MPQDSQSEMHTTMPPNPPTPVRAAAMQLIAEQGGKAVSFYDMRRALREQGFDPVSIGAELEALLELEQRLMESAE